MDRWLWAARLLKTRGLAVEAVTGGRVHVNGQRVKPSKDVRPGDEIELSGPAGRRLTVVVRATALRRGPAREAALLYEETPESRAAGERRVADARLAGPQGGRGGPRPTKRDRRRLESAKGARGGR